MWKNIPLSWAVNNFIFFERRGNAHKKELIINHKFYCNLYLNCCEFLTEIRDLIDDLSLRVTILTFDNG